LTSLRVSLGAGGAYLRPMGGQVPSIYGPPRLFAETRGRPEKG